MLSMPYYKWQYNFELTKPLTKPLTKSLVSSDKITIRKPIANIIANNVTEINFKDYYLLNTNNNFEYGENKISVSYYLYTSAVDSDEHNVPYCVTHYYALSKDLNSNDIVIEVYNIAIYNNYHNYVGYLQSENFPIKRYIVQAYYDIHFIYHNVTRKLLYVVTNKSDHEVNDKKLIITARRNTTKFYKY